MGNKKIMVLFFVFIFPAFVFGQNVRLINSSCQSWSGGIAGRYGNHYNFTVKFSQYKEEPVPDTLWIGQQPTPLFITDESGGQQANANCTRGKNALTFKIRAETFFDDYSDRYAPPGNDHKANRVHAPVSYKGVALLSYRYKGKQHYYKISEIKETYPPVNYP